MADTANGGEKAPQKETGRRDAWPRALRGRLRLAGLILFWEDCWRLGWGVPSLLAGFAAIVLLDLLPMLPVWLHIGALLAFLVALGALALPLLGLRRPGAARAARRLEQDSGLAHRPLEGLGDQLAADAQDPASRALWAAERQRLEKSLTSTRLRLPFADLARRDPLGLRFAAWLLLAVALAGGWRDIPGKITRALVPAGHEAATAAEKLQVWLTPPAYTHMPPILLQSQPQQAIEIPRGTRMLALVQGGPGRARLALNRTTILFSSLDKDSQRLEMPLAAAGRLAIRLGHRELAVWDIRLMAEHAPSVAISGTAPGNGDGRLRLDLSLNDDFGMARAWSVIRPSSEAQKAAPADGRPFETALAISPPAAGASNQTVWLDLADSPWAGLPVTIEPFAENVAGQQTKGAPVAVTLPERHFSNPLAQAIVTLRRHLIAEPDERRPVVQALLALIGQPDRLGADITVYLALTTSASRLIRDGSDDALPSVRDILWQTALHIEDGNLPDARKQLDQAAEDLEKALASDAPGSEIERLTQRLEEAMNRYMQALAEQAERQGLADLPQMDEQTLTSDDLNGMLERMEDMARVGSRDAARQMLQSFRQMMDGLKMGAANGATPEEMRAAREAVNELKAITEQQQGLLDDTFKANRDQPEDQPQGRTGKDGRDGKAPSAVRQEALRSRLGKAMENLSGLGLDLPQSLGDAEQAMRGASKALGHGDLDTAQDAEAEALGKLREGHDQMMSQARQMGAGMTRKGGGRGRDPLGRAMPGGQENDDKVKIPNQADMQKARQILDEIRRRAGETDRPAPERDYLQRLLRQMY